VHAVSVLSRETLGNFMAMIGTRGEALAGDATLVVPHEAVADDPLAARFARTIVCRPDSEGLVRTLATLRTTT
jgi:hypothetical protein